MTTEQRKAIENLSEIVNLSKEELQKENENITAILDYEDLKSLDTVLSLIKEQQEEIVKLKVNLAKSCADRTLDRETLKNQENENLEALHRAYNEELDKKNKQIDLMADKLVEAHEWFYSGFDNFTKEDFIQYFERKVEDVKD